jgi:type III secretion protein T
MQGLDFSQSLHWLLACAIALARPTAMLAFHAAFTRAQIVGLIRGAVAMGLAFPMIPLLSNQMTKSDPGGISLMLLGIKEAIIGAALGLLLGAPLWALDVAGDIMDAQRGATQGRLNDPAGFEDVSISGTMLIMTGIAAFIVTGGLETLADLLYRSWIIWPPLANIPDFNARTPLLLLRLLDQVTQLGLLLALPAVVIMLLTDAALMIATRIAPQLRVDDLALAARNVAFFIFMPLYALFLLSYIGQDIVALPRLFELLHSSITLPELP